MTVKQALRLGFGVACAAASLLGGPSAQAQAPAAAPAASAPGQCARTRAEVREECIAYLKLHRWDEASNNWVLKEGEKPPAGITTRAQIRAERLKYLSTHRWNGALSQWEPIAGTPRDFSKLSRAQVREETRAFMRSHVWDEGSGGYVERRIERKKG